MRTAKGALTICLVSTAAWVAASSLARSGARSPALEYCPVITVSCPDTANLSQPLTFTVIIKGGDPNVTPTFNWTVSAGTISSGQGTGSITVDVQGKSRKIQTATVDVGGYDRSCSTSSSCTIMPGLPPVSRKLDEYGVIPVGEEKLRLDNLVVELQNDPTSQTYLICYGGRRDGPRAARRRCERAKNFLIYSRGIDAGRVVTGDGGYRERLTIEAWVVPPGAEPPRPTPTVFQRGRGRR